MSRQSWFLGITALLALLFVLLPSPVAAGQSRLLGEVDIHGKTDIDKTSGVWVDGQYLGYVDELKGNKKILLLPGVHEIAVRQRGYIAQVQNVTIEPRKKISIDVHLQGDPDAQDPSSGTAAQVKLDVSPERAAVFINNSYVGTAKEFGGIGRAMVIAPGEYQVRIGLPGYQDFTTVVDLKPRQKITIKTTLAPGSILQAGPAIKGSN